MAVYAEKLFHMLYILYTRIQDTSRRQNPCILWTSKYLTTCDCDLPAHVCVSRATFAQDKQSLYFKRNYQHYLLDMMFETLSSIDFQR